MQDGLYNMDTLVKIAIWGVCLYAAYCGFLFLAQRSMLFPRSAIPVVIEAFPEGTEEIWLKTSSGRVEAWFFRP